MKEEVTIGIVVAQLLVNQVALLEAMSSLLLKHCTDRPNGYGFIDNDVIHTNVEVVQCLRESRDMVRRVSESDEHM